MPNALYYGDNLSVLRESIASESVDLIYLDPPFNSQASYNVLFRSQTGVDSSAQIEAFEDTWHWGHEAESAFDQVMRAGNTNVADILRAMRSFLGESDMMAYLAMMAVRLLELHRVLKRTGSLYLHCDPTAGHYLKVLMDGIFDPENFRNEIVWQRTSSHNDPKRYGRIHDTIFFYHKEAKAVWNTIYEEQDDDFYDAHDFEIDEAGRKYRKRDLTAPYRGGPSGQYAWKGLMPPKGRMWSYTELNMAKLEAEGRIAYTKSGMPRLKIYVEDLKGLSLQDVWSSPDLWLNAASKERMHYQTQKPIALLERIIQSSSNEGSVVLDPFCGCGTAVHAAQKLGRQWVGIDITHLAISLIERRLKDAFPGIAFEVYGTPKDLDGARDLAQRDKYQFQWWATSLINAQPYGGKKKGADGGIDGLIYFRSDAKTTERAIVSVKGGGVSVPMVRDLKGVLDREKAPIGVFLTLESPTKPMEKEAASAGFYTLGERQYPRLQIITIEQALAGHKPAIPLVDTGAAFKRSAREPENRQKKLI